MLNVKGAVGKIQHNSIVGLAFYPKALDKTVVVELHVNGKVVVKAKACEYRKRLKEEGTHPSGLCGFRFDNLSDLNIKVGDEICIMAENDVKELRGGKYIVLDELPMKNSNTENIELFIHIGVHKTATSSIQSYLVNNRQVLMEKSVLYPISGCEYGNGHHIIAEQYKRKKLNSVEEFLLNIKNEAIMNRTFKVLISSEQFSLIDDTSNFLLLADSFFHKTTIICTARKQDSLLDSLYNQNVKSRTVRYRYDIESFFEDFKFLQRYDYNKIFDKWSSNVHQFVFIGFENMVTPEKDLLRNAFGFNEDDFLSFAPIDSLANQSIDNKLIYYLRYANLMELDEKTYLKLLRLFTEIGISEKTTLVDLDMRKKLSDNFNLLNENINNYTSSIVLTPIKYTSPLNLINPEVYFSEDRYNKIVSFIKENNWKEASVLAKEIQSIKYNFNLHHIVTGPNSSKIKLLKKKVDRMLHKETSVFNSQNINKFNEILILPGRTVKNYWIEDLLFNNDLEPIEEARFLRTHTSPEIIQNRFIEKYIKDINVSEKNIQNLLQSNVLQDYEVYDSCIYCGEIIDQFGHFILESLSRLWIVLETQNIKKNTIFIFHRHRKTINKEFLILEKYMDYFDLLGISDRIKIVENKAIFCKELLVPDQGYIHSSGISSKINTFWKFISLKASKTADSQKNNAINKVYLSRSNLKVSVRNRKLLNEEALENYLKKNGFQILYPHDFVSEKDKINTLANVDILIGGCGSGMLNSIFMKDRITVVQLVNANFPMAADVLHTISAVKNFNLHSIVALEEDESENWSIDLEATIKILKKIKVC